MIIEILTHILPKAWAAYLLDHAKDAQRIIDLIFIVLVIAVIFMIKKSREGGGGDSGVRSDGDGGE